MKLATWFAAFAVLGVAALASAEEYARPELLVEPAALAKPEVAKEFIVLDARPKKAFAESRVPGARWVDAAAWAKAFDAGKGAEAWGRRIGSLGIDRATKVVIYDANTAKDAARIWWILRYWGVEDVRLLNGGWVGWVAAGLPAETDKPRAPAATTFQATPQAKRLASKGRLLDALKDKSLQIVDARSEGEFCGLDKQQNKRAGAIPGAKHLEWIDLIDKKTQRFKTADQLRTLFRQAGIALEKPTATHCQSGGRASVMAFGMELAGAADVRNYYAGWGEWGNADDTPIVTKETKK
ncbi:MAG: sulfurtransferase [Thermoguttaceae bacterium]|jgi:thiosulfate/3-mercaptopyruvate sulfurtransferase